MNNQLTQKFLWDLTTEPGLGGNAIKTASKVFAQNLLTRGVI